MTRSLPLPRILLLAVSLAAFGCAADSAGGSGDSADEGDPDAVDCKSDAALIAEARKQLVAGDSFFADAEFNDDTTSVKAIEDLNADGIEDQLVAPGLNFAGSNVEMVVFLSATAASEQQAAPCPVYAGDLGGASDFSVAEDGAVTNGVKDLISVNLSNCSAGTTRHKFDGSKYVAGETTEEKVCEP